MLWPSREAAAVTNREVESPTVRSERAEYVRLYFDQVQSQVQFGGSKGPLEHKFFRG